MKIRKAEKKDKNEIINISKYIWDGDDYIPYVLDQWLDDKQGEFTVAEIDGVVRGFAKLTVLRPGDIWLEGIRSHKNFRGHGIGENITKYFINKAKNMDYKLLALSTYIENIESIRIIERNGFRKTTSFKFFYKEGSFDVNNVDNYEKITEIEDVRYILDTKEMKVRNNYMAFDWTFMKIDEELLNILVKKGCVYALKDDKGIKSVIILSDMKSKDNGISISYLDGQDYYLNGIRFALSKYKELGFKSLSFMCPDDESMRKAGYESGMDYFSDYSTDVFVYEYKGS